MSILLKIYLDTMLQENVHNMVFTIMIRHETTMANDIARSASMKMAILALAASLFIW